MPTPPANSPRQTFRDNPLGSRFELFDDGVMSGYAKYDLQAGRVRLLATIITDPYLGKGLEFTMIRLALLSAHHRRLQFIAFCPHARAFLTTNPHFTALIPTH